MPKLKGVPVTLYVRTQTGTDEAHAPIYEDVPEVVENVLIGEPSADDITNELNLTGHRLAYTLGIPKGDTHFWTHCRVDFFGRSFRVYAPPITGIQDLIPLDWGWKVKVESYGENES